MLLRIVLSFLDLTCEDVFNSDSAAVNRYAF